MPLTPTPIRALCSVGRTIPDGLATQHNEAPIIEGVLSAGNGIFELWRSSGGETWTAILTFVGNSGQKLRCIVADGTDLINVIWHVKDLTQ